MKFDYAIETLENRIRDWQDSIKYDSPKETKEVTIPHIKELKAAIQELKN